MAAITNTNPYLALISIFFLLLFSELSSASFKLLSPFLAAWAQPTKDEVWRKLALLLQAIGTSIPLLTFTIASKIFFPNPISADNLVIGSILGNNILILSCVFAMILLSGPLTFFRIRTMASPVFLLFATVIFSVTILNQKISHIEAAILILLALAYSLYFQRYSSEWKNGNIATNIAEHATGDFLPIISLFCMGIGFFGFAILSVFPFLGWLLQLQLFQKNEFAFALHILGIVLCIPTIIRTAFSIRKSSTRKPMLLISLTHACLLNVLLLPGLLALFWHITVPFAAIRVDFPILLFFTGTFACTLLIEKEKGELLPISLILAFMLYTGLGLF